MTFAIWFIPCCWKVLPFHLNRLNSSSPRDVFAKFGWNWSSSSEEDFKISLLWNYLPLEKCVVLHLKNLYTLHPRMVCAWFCWNWTIGSGYDDFFISSIYFHYFEIISPWKRAEPFIWTDLNSLYPKMIYAKFGWYWPNCSVEEEEKI